MPPLQLPPHLIARFRQSFVLLVLAGLACTTVSSAEKLSSVRLHGTGYVSLQQWARGKGFDFHWDKADKVARISISWAKWTFYVDSKKSILNGQVLWLSHAVSEYRDALYISERDLEKTVEPILYPENLPRRRVRTVMIAAGHGGKDPGNQINRQQEKKYALLLAKALKEELRARGYRVLMTRETDVFVELEEQAARANRAKADLFITVHYNAVADVEPNGVETFCLTPAGATSTNGGSPSRWSTGNKCDPYNALLAYKVHKAIVQSTNFEDRGIRRAGFLVLRNIKMPGILVEGGFMSNPSDARKIFSSAHRKVVARAIAEGIHVYKRLIDRP